MMGMRFELMLINFRDLEDSIALPLSQPINIIIFYSLFCFKFRFMILLNVDMYSFGAFITANIL